MATPHVATVNPGTGVRASPWGAYRLAVLPGPSRPLDPGIAAIPGSIHIRRRIPWSTEETIVDDDVGVEL